MLFCNYASSERCRSCPLPKRAQICLSAPAWSQVILIPGIRHRVIRKSIELRHVAFNVLLPELLDCRCWCGIGNIYTECSSAAAGPVQC